MTPRQYPDLAALRGDPSDNLPGIPGVGEKTAAKWVNQFGSFEELVSRADEVKGKIGEKLREHLDSVKRNRVLTELVRDVELPLGIEDLGRVPFDREAVGQLMESLEFRNPNFRERVFGVDPAAAAEAAEPLAGPGVEVVGEVLTEPGALAAWLAEHATGTVAVAALYTWALGSGGVQEVALASAETAAWFDPSQLAEEDERAFAGWLADPGRPKALHIAKQVMRAFAEQGWRIEGVTADTALAAYLEKPGRRTFTLEVLAEEYLSRSLALAAPPRAVNSPSTPRRRTRPPAPRR